MSFIKNLTQWLIGGATVLAVIAAAIAYFDLPPADRAAVWHHMGRVIVWIGLVLVLPWATFFITTAVARRESNAAGAVLVTGYSTADAVLLWLLVGTPGGVFLILAAVLGLLVALTYNLLTCDWIAERNA